MFLTKHYIGYYGVLVGINYWPLIIKLALFAAVLVRFFQYAESEKGARRRYNENLSKIVAAIFSIGFSVAFFLEAWEGIGVFLERSMTTVGNEGIVIFIIPIVVIFAGIVLSWIMLLASDITAIATKKLINYEFQKTNK